MFIRIIMVFCIIQNATPTSYKQNGENQFKHVSRYDFGVNYNKFHAKTLSEENSEDLGSEFRRLFDWVKKILNKNDTKVTTQKTASYQEVMNERLRLRQIEKNLTETFTKLSNVLTQILNIVKHSMYTHFEDIREFLPTKLEREKTYRYEDRYRRGFKEVDIVPTKLYVSKDQNTNEKGAALARINIYNKNQITVHLIRSDDIHNKVEFKKLNLTKMDPKNYSHAIIVKKTLNQGNRMKRDLETELSNINNENGTIHYTEVGNNHLNTLENKNNTFMYNSSKNSNKQENLTKSDIKMYIPAKIGVLSLNIHETRVKRDTQEINSEDSKNLQVVKNIEVKNKNSSADIEVTNNMTDAEIGKNGRRAMLSKKVNSKDEVKNRLFKYIDEAFAEIMKKINSLKETKQMFANDANYQIGYIVSNIDTLEINMRNMKLDMDKNKYIWDDKNILNLYDTVKVSDRAITDLMEILKSYLENSSIN